MKIMSLVWFNNLYTLVQVEVKAMITHKNTTSATKHRGSFLDFSGISSSILKLNLKSFYFAIPQSRSKSKNKGPDPKLDRLYHHTKTLHNLHSQGL